MRVLVCGGRDYTDKKRLERVLDACLPPISELIVGDAIGADNLAWRWAIKHGIIYKRVYAEWQTYGKAAGCIRNTKMLTYKPDYVIAFPGGKGTANMTKQAHAAHIAVVHVPK